MRVIQGGRRGGVVNTCVKEWMCKPLCIRVMDVWTVSDSVYLPQRSPLGVHTGGGVCVFRHECYSPECPVPAGDPSCSAF